MNFLLERERDEGTSGLLGDDYLCICDHLINISMREYESSRGIFVYLADGPLSIFQWVQFKDQFPLTRDLAAFADESLSGIVSESFTQG